MAFLLLPIGDSNPKPKKKKNKHKNEDFNFRTSDIFVPIDYRNKTKFLNWLLGFDKKTIKNNSIK